ncbi:CDP-alcohol phosphatidyltransferase [Planctomycetes bacterium K23_9]|uniref:CDP-alcohol phosphatidyltransferase n=2 Tax=Stieleria marina TaxID=1930275 RepID=A0A517NPH5_9BACT|nr:CDP-alcohol phosphatidyltransferase [Planctomycetes bacterium K23_9]
MYLFPLIIFCNVMDDLDGILAKLLNIGSEFGARLDNVCDAISHSVILMFVGMAFGSICTTAALIAVAVVILRSVSRLDPATKPGTGSPTNELVRHVFFILLLSEQFAFDASPYLIVAFALNAITMILPWKLRFMIRGLTKSAVAIGLVNVALLVAWLVPNTLLFLAAAFIGTYLYSFGWALLSHFRPTVHSEPQ